ncbi:glucose dehydrogenase [Massilia oculi]|uniref:Glucose dehydrogenase n=2 Tax=Massilia oculi TaxID=945844 RepID=A0A2S2DR10_9BURK|nr:glucose dehydrogenase [Massilia oculi]
MVLAPAALFLITSPGAADKLDAVDPATYRIETVAKGLDRPWALAFLPDGRLLVTEMAGRLLVIGTDGAKTPIASGGLPPVFQRGGTIGLMDVAIDPAFARNGLLYLTMGHGEEGANGTRLVRARLENDRLEDVRVLFSSTPKPRAGNNGGRIAFLLDETLVLTVGDGNWRREEAQNVANHLGTVVRLDRDGKAPPDNPFVKRPGAAPEVYSLGHRNPQGIAVDPVTGELLLTEHGARGGDEINRIVAGKNFGWPLVTAGIDYPFGRVTPFSRLAGFEAPLLEWTPSIAPAGLAVYRGDGFPDWRGDLLVPALRGRALHRVVRDGGRIVGQQTLLAELNQRMRDVKSGPDGAIYVLTDGVDASLLRLTRP